ncbi:MAG: DUF4281 domain-containing protein [Gammaproteobacteria bacterium]|nr:DUF4281 domain-containing protein [Gammaproteobacteria bacterium]
MTPEAMFGLVNLLILPAWLLLVFAPRAGVTATWVHSGLYSGLFALAYVAFMAVAWPGISLDYSSLGSVRDLLGHPWVLLAGWVHYLAFDLFVGAWIVRDGRAWVIAHPWLLPPLFLTFYAGPVGLGIYLLMRRLRRDPGRTA